ncbi:hypothetical protein [Paenibacillus flagellatus]|uniref:hypothetical protein n=1 Tax=Paenibacillus flagellatus TaxID=2211139 RepID=UPI00130541CC|nr:hypothetical protein [Paenibacillus flagellatus]
MANKEKLVCLFDKLNETDKKRAFEFIQSLARRSGEPIESEEVKLHGKNFFVVSD